MRSSSRISGALVTVIVLASLGGCGEARPPTRVRIKTPTHYRSAFGEEDRLALTRPDTPPPTPIQLAHSESGKASRSRALPRGSIISPLRAQSGARRDLGRFRATCYQLRGRTATGNPVGTNEVAVDPSVIPLNSVIQVETLGEVYAWDTGGAVKGHHIDVWRPSCAGWTNPYLEVYL